MDILVNAVRITCKRAILGVYGADWSRVMETDLTGTLGACRSLAAPIQAVTGRVIFRQVLMFRTSRG